MRFILILFVLFSWLFSSLATAVTHTDTSQTSQCFSDPQRAYEYLLEQERLAQLASDNLPVNINQASEAELTTLEGVGSSKAQAIIAYREQFGAFTGVDELTKVTGIGEKILLNNRERLTLH